MITSAQSKARLHFMGIRGSGASAAAALALNNGYEVEGSDQAPKSEYSSYLTDKGVKIETSFDQVKLAAIDKLVYTPAVVESGQGNQLIKASRDKNIETLTWQEFVGRYLLKDKKVIGITGTNGKSTTTALIGLILEKAGLDPTVLLGAKVPNWQANFRFGSGGYFVIEADEAYGSFWNYPTDILVITNIQMDHPEFYKDFDDYQQGFQKFIELSKPNSVLVAGPQVALNNPNGKTIRLDTIPQFKLKIPGQYNLENAALATLACLQIGVDENIIREVCEAFTGLSRRFEFKGKHNNIEVYEDFAHHPDGIKKVSHAAKDKFPGKKIWIVFQPHLYSRTKALYKEFVTIFRSVAVDKVVLTKIYASRETDDLGLNMAKMAKEVGNGCLYLENNDQIFKTIEANSNEIDILLILGAGDIYKLTNILTRKK